MYCQVDLQVRSRAFLQTWHQNHTLICSQMTFRKFTFSYSMKLFSKRGVTSSPDNFPPFNNKLGCFVNEIKKVTLQNNLSFELHGYSNRGRSFYTWTRDEIRHRQCDKIGIFLKGHLSTNFLLKLAQIFDDLFGLLLKMSLLKNNWRGYFLGYF